MSVSLVGGAAICGSLLVGLGLGVKSGTFERVAKRVANVFNQSVKKSAAEEPIVTEEVKVELTIEQQRAARRERVGDRALAMIEDLRKKRLCVNTQAGLEEFNAILIQYNEELHREGISIVANNNGVAVEGYGFSSGFPVGYTIPPIKIQNGVALQMDAAFTQLQADIDKEEVGFKDLKPGVALTYARKAINAFRGIRVLGMLAERLNVDAHVDTTDDKIKLTVKSNPFQIVAMWTPQAVGVAVTLHHSDSQNGPQLTLTDGEVE
ncbi:hypothetical protein COB21_04335 [Candidatus Aerophobetes bacterium]|uniref:Uncharacterized protein n=1 Tax=Aerophobetes bacterium TaxID=2030807 RepID=A0A2A4X1S1_UNCAE|nr:MAG: hypothetical protein COB21_04335 [Candidatus Aerophobetes bacterium]